MTYQDRPDSGDSAETNKPQTRPQERGASEAWPSGLANLGSEHFDSQISAWLQSISHDGFFSQNDFSRVKAELDHLRAAGVNDFRSYFADHPGEVTRLGGLVKILDTNLESLNLFKAQGEDVQAANFYQYYAEPFLEVFQEALITFASGGTSFESDMPLRDPRGHALALSLRLSAISGCEQNFSRVVLSLTDVSAPQKPGEELQESQIQFRSLIDHLPQSIFLKDLNSCYITGNLNHARNLGITPNRLKGKTDYDFYPTELAEKYRTDDKRIIETGRTEYFEEKTMIDGNEHLIWTTKIPYADEKGNIIGVLGVFEDITERKRARGEKKQLEAQLNQAQKLEAIGTLAGGIAHDFNNILGVILGFGELALEDLTNQPQTKVYMEYILEAGHRAVDLVKQILTFSRKDVQEMLPISVEPVIKEALKLLRSSLPTTIELKQDISPALGTVIADPTQIYQVLINLCTNASQAMQNRGGVLEVSLAKVHLDADEVAHLPGVNPGPHLRLSVSDTGEGMSQEVLDHIFEPFFTTKPPGEGTGLGLAVVHGIVKNHGGAITASSKPGKGTTFVVFLPVVAEAEQSKLSVHISLPNGSESILWVDDDPLLVKLGEHFLSRLGYQVKGITGSPQALQVFKANPGGFGLVFTDQTMPVLTGLDMAKEMLQLRPGLPIIVCTGSFEDFQIERLKAIGIREVIKKPLLFNVVAEAVRRNLDYVPGT